MSSLASVDLVVLFAEDTPLSLIEAIRPDVLVKGADYRPEQVVGADIVRRNGGQVLLVDLLPSHGTTATIARVRERTRAAGSPGPGVVRPALHRPPRNGSPRNFPHPCKSRETG